MSATGTQRRRRFDAGPAPFERAARRCPSATAAPPARDAYKRSFDVAVLLAAGVLLAPLWVPLALVLPLSIRARDGGPALFRQRRLGRGGTVFEILKFRTMAVGAEGATGPVWAAPRDGRATPLGRVLRRLRLDELPQALNVLRGEMSLVGPRPERPELAAWCEREAPGFARRLAVRPGIAGLAQARGGSTVGPRDKLRYDLLYVRAMGPWLDFRLCVASLLRAVREALPRAAAPAFAAGGGYLRYDDRRPHAEGLNHERRNLECLLAEAHALGRLAILPPLRLAPRHNFGMPRAWCWKTYFDLDGSVLVDAAGRPGPLPLARGAIDAGPPVRVGAGEPVPAGARYAERRVRSPVWRRDVPGVAGAVRIELRPSARVLALAQPVIAAFGRADGGFAAVHLRRGDRLFGPMRWLTRPARIRRRLRALGVADGATVFFLSDERDPAFWRRLEPYYRVVRHADFETLTALVAPAAPERDNYLLYEAEKAVMRAAPVRVETFPGAQYEPADAVLVPAAVWRPARLVRRTVHAGLRLARRVLGERGWRVVVGVRRALRRGERPGDAR